MAITKAAKGKIKDAVAEKFGKANAAIVAEYAGMTMEQLTELRCSLRESGAEFQVMKNRIAKIAIKESAPDKEPLSEHLKGPIGVAFLYDDAAAGTKAVLKFEKDFEKFKVTGGVMDGKSLGAKELKAISDLPSKEVLLGQIVGSLVSPHRGILGVLNGVPRQLVQVINAIKDQKQ